MSSFAEIALNIPLQQSFIYQIPPAMNCQVGMRATIPFRSRLRQGYVVALHHHNPSPHPTILPIKKMVDSEPLFTPIMIKLARWMAHYYMCGLGESLSAMLPAARRAAQEEPEPMADLPKAERISLSAEQRQIVAHIVTLPEQPLYLSGTTGSGKSELLIEAARQVVEGGGGVILLSPQISLASQQGEMLRKSGRLPFALLHSRLTNAQRLYQWRRVLSGEVRCVVGARSAIFAPVNNLQLIIIDEEQDSAYKSGASPRYLARHIAMIRSRWEGAALVMASATPSLEAWYRIKQGTFQHRELQGRPAGGAAPHIQVVSLVGSRQIISLPLQRAIGEQFQSGQQIILLLNRRGFGRTLVCRSCGFTKCCERCSIPLVYHEQRATMLCHYCGYHTSRPTTCPDCNSLDISFAGYGTQLVEQELRRLFPSLRIARVDADSVQRRTSLLSILNDFREHKLDLLLGTQMVAKGLNFRGVQLVGLLLADTSLTLPDFRAEEYTFALITQVAGRAGRYAPGGRVIIQSYRPNNSAIVAAANYNLRQFYETEMQVRQRLSFPPWQRMIRCVLRSQEEQLVKERIAQLAEELRSLPERPFDLLGPVECPLARVNRYWRMHLILSTSAFNTTHRLLASIVRRYRTHRQLYVEIDIDPLSML